MTGVVYAQPPDRFGKRDAAFTDLNGASTPSLSAYAGSLREFALPGWSESRKLKTGSDLLQAV